MGIGIILSFLPWILFFLLVGPTERQQEMAALAGLISFCLFSLKNLKKKYLLDWVTLVFFAFMVLNSYLWDMQWIAQNPGILGNGVLTVMALGSLAVGIPFTEQYAKAYVPREFWKMPGFIHVNRVITGGWGLSFLAATVFAIVPMVTGGDAFWWNELAGNVLVVVAVWLTIWYPDYYRQKGGVMALHGLSRTHFAQTSGGKMGYRTVGQGRPLLLLQGSNLCAAAWDARWIESLSSHYQVILPDYPKIGFSLDMPLPPRADGEELAGILSELVQVAAGGENYTLCGYSLGGWVAQCLAARDRGKIEALWLISTDAGGATVVPGTPEAEELFAREPDSSEDYRNAILAQLFPPACLEEGKRRIAVAYRSAGSLAALSPEVIAWQQNLAMEWRKSGPPNIPEANKLPVKILHGQKDQVVPADNVSHLQKRFPQAKVTLFPEAGHGIVWQCPEKMAEALGVMSSLPNG